MNIKECISDLELQISWIEGNGAHKFPGYGNVVDAMREAIALLKAQEPRVMTLEDVRGLPPFTPVYVEEIDDPDQGIHITEYINEYVID